MPSGYVLQGIGRGIAEAADQAAGAVGQIGERNARERAMHGRHPWITAMNAAIGSMGDPAAASRIMAEAEASLGAPPAEVADGWLRVRQMVTGRGIEVDEKAKTLAGRTAFAGRIAGEAAPRTLTGDAGKVVNRAFGGGYPDAATTTPTTLSPATIAAGVAGGYGDIVNAAMGSADRLRDTARQAAADVRTETTFAQGQEDRGRENAERQERTALIAKATGPNATRSDYERLFARFGITMPALADRNEGADRQSAMMRSAINAAMPAYQAALAMATTPAERAAAETNLVTSVGAMMRASTGGGVAEPRTGDGLTDDDRPEIRQVARATEMTDAELAALRDDPRAPRRNKMIAGAALNTRIRWRREAAARRTGAGR